MASVKDENRDLRKQIGCMNGIFQIFDRHHFLRVNSYSSKRLLQDRQHQMDQQHARKSVMEKGVEVQKEKPRISTESSRASFSSSSCSSTFSSLDFSRITQPETLTLKPISTPQGIRSHDLRDVVKDSMVKPQNRDSNGRRRTVMKHIDSPRPKATPCALAVSKDERLILPRFSYDGRESMEVYNSTMKHEELPRLSLDSKTSSRLSFVQSNQESGTGTHNRRSSVVARLMGLEALPDEEHRQNQVNYSPRVSQTSPVRKTTTLSRFPEEPASWRQQDSPRKGYKSRKAAATSTLHQSSSVYGQIEKRITDLEFNQSGKDLRALKQILEAMQKTRAAMEDERGESAELTSQRRCSLEERCPHQNSNLSTLDTFEVAKPAKVMEKARLSESSHLQNLQTRTSRYHKGKSAYSQKTNNLSPQSRSVKTSWNSSALKTAQCMRVESSTTSCRSSGAVSPRLQQNPLRLEAESGRAKKHGSKKLAERVSQSRKNKVKAKDQQLSDVQTMEVSNDTRYLSCQGDTDSVLSDSNCSLAHSNTQQDKDLLSTSREHKPKVESVVNMLEQPSPISVLDNTFDCEDSPSPIKKIPAVFQEDESHEAEWCLQNLNYLTDSTRMDHSFTHNQKLKNMRKSVQELMQLNKEPDRTAVNHNESLNPAYNYIYKILLKSGDTREAVNGGIVELKSDKSIQRKMILDLVDEILARKITSGRRQTEGKKQTSRQRLLKEVQLEMDRLSRVADCNLELVAADMKHESEEDWVDYRGQVPAVVLDIERRIFKDLINEVITTDWPKQHCRKLFGKY